MEEKEDKATVDKIKVKEENLEVAGTKCWRGKWLSVLRFTGKIFKKLSNEGKICNYQS